MGRGFNRSGTLVFVAVTAFWQFAGCGGRAVVPSDSGDSASVSGGAGASNAGTGGSTGVITVGVVEAGTVATGNGGESQTAPNVDAGCESVSGITDGQPCPTDGEICGPGGCTLNCYCVARDAGTLTWECWAPPCK